MADKLPVGDTIDNLKTDGQKLVQDSKALVTAEIKPAAKHAGIGVGMFGGAGYFGIVGALLLWLCGAFAFSLMWQHIGNWDILLSLVVGFATMAVVLFILAGILALAGKVSLDDNAQFRHEGHAALVDERTEDPLEAKAKANDLNYVKLDGQVGVIGNGAGLVMSTLDVVAYAGEQHGGVKPANFLDIGGGANAEVMANGLDVILGDEQVKSVFVNVFGGITSCDTVAQGIVTAVESLGGLPKPVVVRLDGNAVEEGRRILQEANHPLVTLAATMDEGADKAAELAHSAN